ncbi:MAG: SdiA-regulated domain-containing protein [Bacteroidota bacterium]
MPYQYEDAHYRVAQVGRLPNVVNESSGLAFAADTNSFWTLNDGGGRAELYHINRQGQLLATLQLNGLRNVDWEELSKDTRGNLYIGDTGNNWNMRHALRIYQVNPSCPQQVNSICFRYADQEKFPPVRKDKNFDCEAFFYYQDSLYLFSKNRGDKQVKIYAIPATPGTHVAKINDKTYLEPITNPYANQVQVSSADVSPDGKTFALLTYSAVYLFEIKEGQINFQHPLLSLQMDGDRINQVEALAFINHSDFIFTNEQREMFEARRKP